MQDSWPLLCLHGRMATMTAYIPSFCRLHSETVPLQLPDTRLVVASFDVTQLHSEDFQRCAIAPVRGVAKRQSEYLAGRLCAREALRQLGGRAIAPARSDDGMPLWPEGTVGSITHSAGQAVAIAANSQDWRSLGLDLEKPLSSERATRLAEGILTPNELQRASELDATSFARRVTLTFSLKESLFKVLYPLVRKRFYFHDAELLDHDDQHARLRLLLDLHTDWPAGRELDGRFAELNGYLLSLIAV